jgi:hypothetical protein
MYSSNKEILRTEQVSVAQAGDADYHLPKSLYYFLFLAYIRKETNFTVIQTLDKIFNTYRILTLTAQNGKKRPKPAQIKGF